MNNDNEDQWRIVVSSMIYMLSHCELMCNSHGYLSQGCWLKKINPWDINDILVINFQDDFNEGEWGVSCEITPDEYQGTLLMISQYWFR